MTGPRSTGPQVTPGRTLLGAAAGIAVVTVAARVVGFARTAVFTNVVGAGCLGTTYTVANAVPNVVFEVVAGGALAALVVPVLAPVVADRALAARTASALLTWTVLLLVPVALAVVVAAPTVVRLLLGSTPCGPRAEVVATAMLRVFAPQVVLYGLAVVLVGVLQAHRRFLAPALAPLLSSLVVAAAYLVYAVRGSQPLDVLPRSQELVLSVGTTAGVAVLALTGLVALRRTGLRLRPALGFPPGAAAQVRRLALAGVAALAAQQAALVVALRLAASGSAGGAVVFTTATTVFLLPWAVLAVPVATSAAPRLAGTGGADDAELVSRSLRAVLVLTCLGAAVLVAVALPVGRLLGGGAPGELAAAVRAFAPGLVGYGLVALLSRVLYARGAGRRAAVATVAGWLAVVVADLLLVGLTDLAPATALGLGNTVGMTLGALVLLAGVGRLAGSALARSARSALAAAAAGSLAALAAAALPASTAGSAGGAVLRAALLAAVAVAVFAAVLAVADRAVIRELRHG